MRAFAIAALGTDFAKSLTTAMLLSFALKEGKKACVMKPVQTGTKKGTLPLDLTLPQKLLKKPLLGEKNLCPFVYPEPISPHLAAERAGLPLVDEYRIQECLSALLMTHQHVILETAGGVLTPLRRDYFNADLLSFLKIPVILVIKAHVGTISETLCALLALSSYGIKPIAFVVSSFSPHDDFEVLQDSIQLIEKRSSVPFGGLVPFLQTLPKDAQGFSLLAKKHLNEIILKPLRDPL